MGEPEFKGVTSPLCDTRSERVTAQPEPMVFMQAALRVQEHRVEVYHWGNRDVWAVYVAARRQLYRPVLTWLEAVRNARVGFTK